MWECGERYTDTQTAVTTIHFASAAPHAKCNNVELHSAQRPYNKQVSKNAKSHSSSEVMLGLVVMRAVIAVALVLGVLAVDGMEIEQVTPLRRTLASSP